MNEEEKGKLRKNLGINTHELDFIYNLICEEEGAKPSEEERECVTSELEKMGISKRTPTEGIEMTDEGVEDFLKWMR